MTTAALSPSKSYIEDGVTLNFAVPFRYLTAGSLAVDRISTSGTVTRLVLGVDYTATAGTTDAGGTLTLLSTVALARLRIRRATPRSQSTDYATADTFPAESHEAALDRAMLIDQEQDVQIADTALRALLVPDGETAGTLPAAAARAGQYMIGLPGGGFSFASGTGTDAGLRADLASSAAGKGGALVADVLNAVNIASRGAQGTTSISGFDCTAIIQAALDTGRHVYVPPLSDAAAFYRVTAELVVADGQVLFGAGARSMIRQTTINANVIALPGRTGAKVQNLGIWACGTKTGFADGMGVDIRTGSTRCEVSGCTIKGHLGWGIGISNSSENKIIGNWLISSTATDAMKHDEVGGDIYIYYASSNNLVLGNHCISGNGVAIGIQTIVNGDAADGNQILFNNIRDPRQYGIMAYRNAQILADIPTQSVFSTIIVGNRIRNVTGAVAHRTGGYVYGTAIYVQGAEGTLVDANTIVGSHTAAVTFIEQLAPGAIGATNVSQIDVTNNSISSAGWSGIWIGDPNDFGFSTGFAKLTGNNIKSTVRDAIKVVKRGRIAINDNTIDAPTLCGVYVANTVQKELVSVCDNMIRNPGLSAMEIAYCSELRVNDNTAKGAGVHSLYIDNSADVIATGNHLENHAVRGLHITATNARVLAQGNTIRGNNAAGTVGMQLDANGIYWPNLVTNHVTDFAGTWKDMRTLTVNSTTPSVLYGHAFVTANTGATLISFLLDGYDGQEVIIVIRDAFTTIDFTGTNMKGNGGADWAAPINGSMRCIFNKTLGAWFCTVQGA